MTKTVFWLVLFTSPAGTPLHVGNFPTLDACQTAAKEIWGYYSNAPRASSGYYAYCIPANTGNPDDPPPPN
jgi:hypothetical protein